MSELRQQEPSAVTIPGKILRFLDQHANLAFAGTRNRELVPFGHRVTGWFVNADDGTFTALVSEHFTTNLVESLQDNAEFALTVGEFPSHETYQFKGRYRQHRPVHGRDLDVAARIRDRFVKSVRQISDAPEDVLRAYIQTPALAVEFEVREVYLQTPGPGAGTRIMPPAET
jgi:hypothetical protein